uniref:Peptidase S1 domain-containing protein n=1 Tax=Syphacia muris TaxID=451379 RepID=A0A0N5A9Q0_9BILA
MISRIYVCFKKLIIKDSPEKVYSNGLKCSKPSILILEAGNPCKIGQSSILVSTPRCGRGDTGSIPVLGIFFPAFTS